MEIENSATSLRVAASAKAGPHSAFRNWGMREAEIYRIAFEKEKELTDRALKLAEISKPRSNWELQGVLRMAVFVLGFFLGK